MLGRKTLTLACFKRLNADHNTDLSVTEDRLPRTPATSKVYWASAWAKEKHEIKRACTKFSDVEIFLYEAAALSSWENR